MFAIVFRWVEVDLKIITKVVSAGKYERSFNHQNLNPADGNADEVKSIVKFWKLHKDQMPSMCKFIRYAYTITTSSAPAERVFSVIKRSFDKFLRIREEKLFTRMRKGMTQASHILRPSVSTE